MRRSGALVASVALTALYGCPDEPDAEAPKTADASAETPVDRTFEDEATGVRFAWPATWKRVAAPSGPADQEVRTLAKVKRVPTATPVPPRLELTVEPTTLEDPDLAARRTKNVLEATLESAGAKVQRASLSRRAINGRFIGVLDATYAVPSESSGSTDVRHRALIARVEDREGHLVIATLSATYLSRDHALVKGEVDAIFDSFTGPPPKSPPAAPKAE